MKPRLIPILTVQTYVPVWARSPIGSPVDTFTLVDHVCSHRRTVDYATRDGKTFERFGPPGGLKLYVDCYGITQAA